MVLAPTGRDGTLIADILSRAGHAAEACEDVQGLCAHRRRDGGGRRPGGRSAGGPGGRLPAANEVARQVRTELGDGIFLVALTGYGQPEDRSRAVEAGFNVHLVKPVDGDHLAQVLADGRDAGAAVDPRRPRSPRSNRFTHRL